jgi:predicted ATPase
MTIYALEVKDPKRAIVPHWGKVPWLAKADKIEFKPGVNIVFGPNGSGKSTLIQALAMMKHCFGSGLPVVTENSIRDFSGDGFRAEKLRDGLVLRCDDEVCRYASPDLKLARYAGSIDDDFGFEQIQQMFAQRAAGAASSGEKMIGEIARIAFAQGVEIKHKHRATEKDFTTQRGKKLYKAATKALYSKGRKTMPRQQVLLFDEVERSMDFVNEAMWWDKIEHARKGVTIQVILATHSPFALAMNEDEVNFIETSPGYIEKAREAMADAGWRLSTDI